MILRQEPEDGTERSKIVQVPAVNDPHAAAGSISILLLGDNSLDAELVERKLKQERFNYILTHVTGRSDFETALGQGCFDLIVSDYALTGFNGLAALEIAKQRAPASPFIFISGTVGEELAIESLQSGATDYVLKDRMTRFGPAIRRALAGSAEREEKLKLENQFSRAQRMASIGALAGGIAHYLNNALAPIVMGIDLLIDSAPHESMDLLRTMRACARHGTEMVKQILSFARGVSGEPVLLDFAHVIHEMEKLVKEVFPRSIEVRTKLAKGLYQVKGNATQLHQILLNVCVNARDAMPDGGVLTIEAENVASDQTAAARKSNPVSGPYVLISVSDTGHGMSAEVLGRIFEPFFSTKPHGLGSGLGLSTVKSIVEKHNGFVEVLSEEWKGTVFRAYFPAAAAVDALPVKSAKPPVPAGHGEQILIIDDEMSVLETMREILEAFSYRPLTARHGGEALALYEQHAGEIQAVISDMMMPVMDGPTTINAIRKIHPTVRVVGITGLGADTPLVERGKLSADAFVEKPFSIEALLTTLHQVLAGSVDRPVDKGLRHRMTPASEQSSPLLPGPEQRGKGRCRQFVALR